MTKKELQALLKKLFIRNGIEENHVSFYKGMNKKELKTYVNENGGFTKGKVKKLSFDPKSVQKENIPEDAFFFEAILSDESVNMNGYRILLSAWQEGFKKYFEDYEGSVYLQHDMDQPIGKTLSINVDADVLASTGYAWDDLTEKRVSRGLITDISTGHIPLEIYYINDETGERLTPEEFYDMLRDMIDQMYYVDKKSWDEIKQAIAELRAKWIETHTKVQIVEYSFVSVGANTNAGVKSISNNTIEILNNELPDDVVIEDDEQVAEVSEEQKENNDTELESEESQTQEEEEEKSQEIETQPTTEETPTTDDPVVAENNLEDEGETPKGDDTDKGDAPENGEAPDSTVDETEQNSPLVLAQAEILTLKAQLGVKDEEIEQLKVKTAELEELVKFNASKKKVVATNEVISGHNASTKSLQEVSQNVKKFLRR